MKATVEKIESNRVVLEVEVEAPQLAKALDRAYRKLVRQVNIPGFRRGKAPRFILERYLGKEPLYHEAIDMVVPEAYRQAVEETKIEPIDHPQVEIIQAEEGQPLIFKATVEVKPEVILKQYKGVEVRKPEVKVTEEDVEQYLKSLQERYAELKDAEDGTVREGDTVFIDFQGFIDGEEHPGLKGENYPLEIGSGTFIADFEAQLVGAKVDEEREVKVTFPENYFRQELAGKDAVFQVKIRAIKRKHLLPLDDEFAKDVSECETLEELKADIKRRLEKEREEWAKAEIRRQVVEKVVEDAQVEVPKVLVERRIDRFIEDFAWHLRSQGSSLEKFMERTGKNISDLREDFRARAEKQVKTELVLEAVAKQEGLTATPEEIEKEIQEMARILKKDPLELKEKMGDGLERLKYDIIINKAAQFLVEHSIPVVEDKEEGKESSGGEIEDVSTGTDSSRADQ